MRSSWLLSITLVVVVLACGRRGSGVSDGSDASSGSCTEDIECGEGRMCVDGRCVDAVGESGAGGESGFGGASGTGGAVGVDGGMDSGQGGAGGEGGTAGGDGGEGGMDAGGSGGAAGSSGGSGSGGAGGMDAGGSGGAGGTAGNGGSGGTGGMDGGASGTGGAVAGDGAVGDGSMMDGSAGQDGDIPVDGGQGDAGTVLVENCVMGSTEPCASFLSPDDGTVIQLGPHGAIMEPNLGQDYALPVNAGESACSLFMQTFGEDPELGADLVDLGALDLTLFTVYGPAITSQGEVYPVIIWGNGTCLQPEAYGALLRYVASHGYYVFAPNSRYVGGNSAMTVALNFAVAANSDPESDYYQKLDTTRVGAMGHSQGSAATANAASDDRIDAVILFNGGTSAAKPFLAVSGETDIGNPTANSYAADVNAAAQPGAYLFYHDVPQTGNMSGHLTVVLEPERVTGVTLGWWDYMLKGNVTARDLFVGDDCGLCIGTDIGQGNAEYGSNGRLP